MNLCALLLSLTVVASGFPFEKVVEDPLPEPLNLPVDVLSLEQSNQPYDSELFGGDLILTEEQKQYINALGNNGELKEFRSKRGAPYVHAKKWPKNQPIPFYFNANIAPEARVKIRQATMIMSANTCIDYKENGNGVSKIEFYNGAGCSSALGAPNPGDNTFISMNTGCEDNKVTILHELTHSLGIDHTQNRFDRDRYVTVNYDAISLNYKHNYDKLTEDQNNNLGLPYEYGSAMHYGPFDFTTGRQPSIIPKDAAYQKTLKQRNYMTFNDYKMINTLYNCTEKCKVKLICQNGGYMHHRDCNRCVCNPFYTGLLCEKEKQTQVVQSKYTTVFEQEGDRISDSFDYETFKKDEPRLIKAPVGRRLNVTIMRMDNIRYLLGCSSCKNYGIELTDGDLSLVGKIFCCEEDQGLSFISKTNVIGYKAYSYYVRPFHATVSYTVV